ncbi:syncoilin-like [Narcine bancroftii]|uniref:syncoilin-like n=1 Tax=Narcine bancroftii TaxID=1343680 RepID=UPI003831EBFB
MHNMGTVDELCVESPIDIIGTVDSLQALGKHFQSCIKCLEELLEERENLIREIIFTKEPMHQEICDLRAKLLMLYHSKSETDIECDNYKEEITCIKRKLFEVTKAHMTYKYEMYINSQGLPQMVSLHETLKSKAQVLSDELAGLKKHYHEEIRQVIHQLENIGSTNNILPISRSQETNKFQNLLAEQRQWLEKYHEPKMKNLMSWNKSRAETLRQLRQEVKCFRGQLQSLQEQVTMLINRKQFLEQQLQFTERQWGQDIMHLQTQKTELEAKVDTLKAKLVEQKEKNDSIRYIKESLSEELDAYRERLITCGNLIQSTMSGDPKTLNPN